MTASLTPVQARLLATIRELTVDHVPPSYEELRVAMGFANKGRVQEVLKALRARGVVTWTPGAQRSLQVRDDALSIADLRRMSDGALQKLTRTAWSILDERGLSI